MEDGYDLPPALKDWLYPTDGTTRDFATLQVVFGRGEEYFASDKNGKLEYKEPEVKKQVEEEEKINKPALRRARTVSFLRPLSDVSTRSDTTSVLTDTTESRRSSAVSSRRASRPPSLSYSRTSSVASFSSEPIGPPSGIYSSRHPPSPTISQWKAQEAASEATTAPTKRISRLFEPPVVDSISEELAPILMDLASDDGVPSTGLGTLPILRFQVPVGYMLAPVGSAATTSPSTCICGCHETRLPKEMTASYSDASIQTDNVPSPSRTALRIDTTATSQWSSEEFTAVSQAELTPAYDNYHADNPTFMGRMMNYFSKPGYQLGDSLSSAYHTYEPPAYQYQDTFDSDTLHT
jgi:hypothetical protein